MIKHLLPVLCLVMLAGCNPFDKMEKTTEKKVVRTQADDMPMDDAASEDAASTEGSDASADDSSAS